VHIFKAIDRWNKKTDDSDGFASPWHVVFEQFDRCLAKFSDASRCTPGTARMSLIFSVRRPTSNADRNCMESIVISEGALVVDRYYSQRAADSRRIQWPFERRVNASRRIASGAPYITRIDQTEWPYEIEATWLSERFT